MITCEWMGRLGNNMFQIAIVYAMAQKHGDIPQFPMFPYFNLPRRTEKVNFVFGEPKPGAKIPYQQNMSLAGFYQNYRYFDNIKNQLINIFQVPCDWQPNTIAVHVRRGDFLVNTDDFPVQPVKYYMDCLKKLDYKNKKVVFVSDDIEWCRQNFEFASFREWTNEIDDIYFMANADAVVMSNSTFSFWGAYLNTRQRPVYFPLDWFNKKGRTGYEICPEHWIGL